MRIRNCFVVTPLCLIALLYGCIYFSAGPADTVRNVFRHVERGEIEAAAQLHSSGFINKNGGLVEVKSVLALMARDQRERGGFKSVQVIKEDAFGELANVTIRGKFPDGTEQSVNAKLIKENGTWKVDNY